MKKAKLLAAAMAGTLVFATSAPVFAGTMFDAIYDGWWWTYQDENGNEKSMTEDEVAKSIVDTGDLDGDGTYSYTMKCIAVEGMDEEAIENRAYVVTGDIFDDNDNWISFGTNGDLWNGGTGSSTNSGANTSVDFVMHPGNYLTVEITRTGLDFTISLFKDGSKLLRLTAANSNLLGTIHTRAVAQFGVFERFDTIEGDAATSLAQAQASTSIPDLPGESAAAESEAAESEATDDAAAPEETASNEDGDSAETTGTDDAAASDDNTAETVADNSSNQTPAADSATDSSSATTTDNSAETTTTAAPAATTQTGDEGVIFFVAIALAGCAAIAFASRKRFIK